MIVLPFSIPITIQPLYWVLIAIIGWMNSQTIEATLIWGVAITLSLLIHEFGHALTAQFFGQKAEIYLETLGGVTRNRGPTLSHPKQFLLVLNGPLAGFALYFLSVYLFYSLPPTISPQIAYFFKVMMVINLFWTLLNLIPVFPLDGGQLLRIFFEGLWGTRGLKIAFFLSLLTGVSTFLFFIFIQQFFIAILFFMFAFESYRQWDQVRAIAPADEDQAIQYLLSETEKAVAAKNYPEAVEKARSLRYEAPKGIVYVRATELGGQSLAALGELKEAYNWLYPLKNRLSPSYVVLLQQIAYRLEEWEEAAKLGEKAYEVIPSANTALLTAYSYAMLGEATQTVGWMRCAKQAGLSSIESLLKNHEFDAVRSSPIFQSFEKSNP